MNEEGRSKLNQLKLFTENGHMKSTTARIFFLFLLLVECNQIDLDPPQYSTLASAVKEIVDKVFSERHPIVNLIFSAVSNNKDDMEDLKNETLSAIFINPKVVVRKESSAKLIVVPGRRKLHSIFIIDSFEGFLQIYQQIAPQIFRFFGLFLVVLVNGEITENEQIFELLWRIQIYNVNVVFEFQRRCFGQDVQPVYRRNRRRKLQQHNAGPHQ